MNDEKKKQAIVGALLVVMLAIGAFQFVGGGSPPPPVETKKAEAKPKEDEKPPLKNPQVADSLPARDPFQAPADPAEATPAAPTPPVTAPPVPAPVKAPIAHRPRLARHWEPSPEAIGGTLPDASGPSGSPTGTAPVTVEPVRPPEPVFGYSLAGTIVGVKSAAVMRDAQGNQRLVPVGTAIDGDTQVVAVDAHSVTVNFRGKRLRLKTEGDSGGK